MGKKLYLECNNGISGDMLVAALLDLGADKDKLEEILSHVPEKGFRTEVSRVKKGGIDCCDFNVILDDEHDNHDHDMAYLYEHEGGSAVLTEEAGHGHGHSHDEEHEHEHHHEHGHSHEHEHHEHGHEHHDHEHHEHEHYDHEHHEHEHHHGHEHSHGHGDHHHHDGHVHRNLQDVTEIIDALPLSEGARAIALKAFRILAEAEAKAHAASVETVHFHEVGALDSIIDIVAAAFCLDDLGIKEVLLPRLCEGSGTVRCQHGILPVPVPAVANIAEAHALPLSIINRKGELVTPTGAALSAAIVTGNSLPDSFHIIKTGIGAGKRAYEIPSILRAMLIEENGGEVLHDHIVKLESNIDDSTGEALGHVMEKLFKSGARDVHFHPVFMKKNRPGWQVNIICDEDKVPEMEGILFTETSTIGIRRLRMERTVLPRREEVLETEAGDVRIKVCSYDGKDRFYPEYDSVAAYAEKTGLPYPEALTEVMDKVLHKN